MEKHHKFSIWYVLIAVCIVHILQNAISQKFQVQQGPYSEFVKSLQNGKVVEVAIAHDRIQGKMRTPKTDFSWRKANS